LENPQRIQQILDHVVVASLPEAYPRWEFLLERSKDERVYTIEEAFGSSRTRYQMDSGDIRIILETVLEDIHEKGFDVIIIDQTNVEAAQGGLYAAKALIPGMTPITFGYASRRVHGLKRVFELPRKLGYRSHVLSSEELNVHLHPFS
jgi:ribosomal protein S12 methylthiotransferase accessory factor